MLLLELDWLDADDKELLELLLPELVLCELALDCEDDELLLSLEVEEEELLLVTLAAVDDELDEFELID